MITLRFLLTSLIIVTVSLTRADIPTDFASYKVAIVTPKEGITLQAEDNDQVAYILEKAGISDLKNLTVEFGGKYSIITTGCGTMCQVSIAVNLLTGQVLGPITSSLGICYQKDSELFITNPDIKVYGDEIPDWAFTNYYR